MPNFETIYDGMTTTYNKLQSVMGELYDRFTKNPDDDFSKYMFDRLVEVSKWMLSSEKDLTTAYCKDESKSVIQSQIDNREFALEQGVASLTRSK